MSTGQRYYPPRTKRVSSKAIVAALYATRGLVHSAAARLGCTSETIYRRMREEPAILAARDDAQASILDLAETRLYERIDASSEPSIFFFLKTRGRDRGYLDVGRRELTGPDGERLFDPLAALEGLSDEQLSRYVAALAAAALTIGSRVDECTSDENSAGAVSEPNDT